LALFFGCFLLTGSYLCYDYPAFLYDYLISDGLIDGENASFRFNLLYSAYSFPNIVLPFLSGIFIDKMGVHKGIILFSCLVCLGQGLGVVSALAGSYGLMVAGRFVYGFGGDSLNVTQSNLKIIFIKRFGCKQVVSRVRALFSHGVQHVYGNLWINFRCALRCSFISY